MASLLVVVAELKQASSQLNGELDSELPKDRGAVHQPHNQLFGQLSSELPVPQTREVHSKLSNELPSELPSKSPTITSDAGSTLTNAPISEEMLSSHSKLPSESPILTTNLDSNPPTTDASINEKAPISISELLEESQEGSPHLNVILTQATVSADTLTPDSELLSESPNSSPHDVTLTQAMVRDDVLAANNQQLAAQKPSRLTGMALARRLGVASASISRNKQKQNFAAWTSIHDPDGIAWEFDGQTFGQV